MPAAANAAINAIPSAAMHAATRPAAEADASAAEVRSSIGPARLIRLPNHLGDACMALPALEHLAAAAAPPLEVAGRAWAGELLAALPWRVHALTGSRGDRVATLRGARAARPGVQGALLTNSFSSALEFALAGGRAGGYRRDARGWLLAPGVPVPAAWHGAQHTAAYYLHLAHCLTGAPAPDPAAPPPVPRLPLLAAARERARVLRAAAGVHGVYAVICPLATGLHQGQDKRWPGFAELAASLAATGLPVLCFPGPGERAAAAAAAPAARHLDTLDLQTFGAMLADSAVVVANDSGPGHLAAAVGARLVSVFGVTDPLKTCPLGAQVRKVGQPGAWPRLQDVQTAVESLLRD
jgi:heptosyltransferase-2